MPLTDLKSRFNVGFFWRKVSSLKLFGTSNLLLQFFPLVFLGPVTNEASMTIRYSESLAPPKVVFFHFLEVLALTHKLYVTIDLTSYSEASRQ